jgi:hypothetical protein
LVTAATAHEVDMACVEVVVVWEAEVFTVAAEVSMVAEVEDSMAEAAVMAEVEEDITRHSRIITNSHRPSHRIPRMG